MIHCLVITLVFWPSGEYGVGQVERKRLSNFKELPADTLTTFASSGRLITAKNFIAIFVTAISVRFNNARVAVITKFKNFGLLYSLQQY